MTDIQIAGPLAAALAAKGYASLTPVQSAMLGEGVAGRDLLVSAQTGSGKTVAFGIAVADEILRGAEQLLYADAPVALVIAPTRELALQVARELDWLYEGAQARIATCVGGMDYRTEKRALERGAHIVVGTPGRLKDHIERQSLDMSAIRAVVLDEADEMLDLGFREDLEFILQAAPSERRTLMFSATVPREIAALAQDFQKDALRIVTQGEARQHVDIEYRAISVAARDKEHAIFNLLRFYESQAAIVFCKTRANVAHLFARMTNRGFAVVALSGELSQSERTHALQALRDGRARVCIATDVAARGIDLPGLELVIHADLPSNSEVLLHRSGRTGRAGHKGVSALVVVPAEFKKAQRLLAGAKVVADWGKPPSAEEVQERDDLRMLDHPALTDESDEGDLGQTLLGKYGAERVAAAFIRLWRQGRSAPEVLSDAVSAPNVAPRERSEFGPSVWFVLSVGRAGRAEARWLLPKICEAGGITKDGIGAIRVQEDRTFVQILTSLAGRFGPGVELESGVTMARIEGEPDLDRPERKPYAGKAERRPPMRDEGAGDRREKPAYVPKPPRLVADEVGAPPAEAVGQKADVKPAPRRAGAPHAAGAAREKQPYVRRDHAQPYAPREGGERKPHAARGDGERKAYPAREGGEKKPYGKRDAPAEGPRKPRWAGKAEGVKSEGAKPRSAGFKSHGAGAGKPARSEGYKSQGGTEGAGRAAGVKPHGGEGKAFARPKPKPVADARDTSKRFVPPKKPKG